MQPNAKEADRNTIIPRCYLNNCKQYDFLTNLRNQKKTVILLIKLSYKALNQIAQLRFSYNMPIDN
jgi:hypothetical protein